MPTRRQFVLGSAALLTAGSDGRGDAPAADPTRVLPPGHKPEDARLGPPKTLNGYFPFAVPATREAWVKRRAELREQVLVATGLWPMPEKTPLHPVVHGRIERDGYTIEKVFFSSLPGHTVTGNLYRPAGPAGMNPAARPAVLFAHGHWKDGRLHDAGEAAAKQAVASGGEGSMASGRFFMQALPVALARLGFVVFQYDMVGYADSTAIPHILKSGVPHPKGFADAAGELRLQSLMGLQTWNSVRALDFLCGLPDVDPAKVGVTGASGGATQTLVLCGIDDRPAAPFPAVMVSTGMQGGCVCENCSLLRVGTGNVELAALFAPKPLAMSAADDWTKELMTKGFPELKQLYTLLGAPDNVAAKAWLQYPHNYNQPAREFMEEWFSQHLLGKPGPVHEKPFEPVPPAELSVYDAAHPRPADELPADKLRAVMTKASDARMARLFPKDARTLAEFRRVVGTALRAMTDGGPPAGTALRRGMDQPSTHGGVALLKAVIGRPGGSDAVPALVVRGQTFNGRVVVWLHPAGKASLFGGGRLTPAAQSLLDAGFGVLAPDLFGTGELAGDKPFPVNPVYAGFTYGYNLAPLADRVRDVLTTLAFARDVMKATDVRLVGWGAMGPVAVLAKALAGDAIAKTAADLHRFRFEEITATDDPMLLPGAVKYGGLPAFLALCAPGEVLAHNPAPADDGKLPAAAYAAANATGKLTLTHDKFADAKVVEWLVT